MTHTTAISTDPSDDRLMDMASKLLEEQDSGRSEADVTTTGVTATATSTSTNPFDDPASLLAADVTPRSDIKPLPPPQAQDIHSGNIKSENNISKPSTNPFDDEDQINGTDQQQPQEKQEKGSLLPMGDENRDRYEHDDEEDSVKSMLEMMEHKQEYRNTHAYFIRSLRSRARNSLAKTWRLASLGGAGDTTKSIDNKDIYFDDDESFMSYDCIALSSLQKMRENGGVFVDDDDEESLRSNCYRPKLVADGVGGYPDDHSKSSEGTNTTKNTHGTLSNRSENRKTVVIPPRRRKYVYLVASFLALLLLLGIMVLSYSLYALRHDDTDGLSIFTREFWTEDVPNTLLFWRNHEDEEIGESVSIDNLDDGPVH